MTRLPAILLLIFSLANSAMAQTLLDRWPCQDNAASTTVVATTGSNGTLSANSSTVTVADGPGTALARSFDFNGTYYFSITDRSGSLGTNWALAWWMKLDATTPSNPAYTGIANLGPAGASGATHWPYSDGTIYTSLGRYTNSSTPNRVSFTNGTSRNVWRHWCVTNSSGANNYKVYLDGVQIYQTTGTTTPYWTGSAWTIGRSQDNIPNYFYIDGRACDFRLYTSTLDSTMLTAIMAEKDLPAGKPTIILQLLSDWKLKQQKHLDTYGVYALCP